MGAWEDAERSSPAGPGVGQRYLTMAASWLVMMGWAWECPAGGFRRGVRCHGDAVVVIGDGIFYSLFSVIADWAAAWSTMALLPA